MFLGEECSVNIPSWVAQTKFNTVLQGDGSLKHQMWKINALKHLCRGEN